MAKDSTRSVHGTEKLDESTGSVVAPIYQTVTYGFRKAVDVDRAVRGVTDDFVYTRWDNPTTRILEKKLADLEGAEDCAFFSSGMAAISTAYSPASGRETTCWPRGTCTGRPTD